VVAIPHSDGVTPAAAMRNWMIEEGARLLDGGYPVIPIAAAAKFPGQHVPSRGWEAMVGWQRFCDRLPKAFEIDIWRRWPGCGVGIAGGLIVGADIDVMDADAAGRIEALARAELGDTPAVRIGRAPKKLLVYRSAKPFQKMARHPIEIIARGGQFVAYGTHPETREPYRWPVDELSELPLSALPVVTEEQCRRFLDAAYAMVPPELRRNKLGPDRSAEFYRAQGGELRGTVDAVREALAYIPNDDLDYDSWIRIGLALKGALGDDGLPLWLDWSAQSKKSGKSGRDDTARRAWRGFKPREIGAGSIYFYAGEQGWNPDNALVLNGAVAAAAQAVPNPGAALIAKAVERAASGTVGRDETGPEAESEAGEEPNVEEPPSEPGPNEPPPDDSADIVAGAGGILGEVVGWMIETARFPQPLLCLGAAIATCGALMGHRYRLLDGPDTRTNVMILGLAGSGSGKDHPRRCIISALDRAGLGRYYHGRDMASAQGIIANLSGFFAGVALVDEAGHFFANIMGERAPAHLKAIASLLTELSTSAAGMFMDAARAANKDPDTIRYDIPDPCFGLFATTVAEPLWAALNSGHAIDGFLARFLMFETPLNYPDPQFGAGAVEERIGEIAGSLRRLVVGPGVQPTDLAVNAWGRGGGTPRRLGRARGSAPHPHAMTAREGRRCASSGVPRCPSCPCQRGRGRSIAR
jgi:hypothetical protein